MIMKLIMKKLITVKKSIMEVTTEGTMEGTVEGIMEGTTEEKMEGIMEVIYQMRDQKIPQLLYCFFLYVGKGFRE